ncbi:MAG: pectate lyase, partial [Firmicutes bacterium]|nr:pectate lyase [Bacillota bacterium]
VTNLNDSGEGSFRDAVSQSNRIIVFDVSGTIMLKSRLMVKSSNLTILGQTAPGEGICIGGESVAFEGKNSEEGLLRNVIVRYLRFRMGDNSSSSEDGVGVKFAENVILDHCSVSWSVDECLSSYAVKNFTAQWCIVSESLNNSVHPKGSHGYGGIWGGINSSFHHNLVSHHTSRNPRIAGTTVGTYLGTPQSDSAVDIRNNVFYAWGHGSGYGRENGVRVNFVNNYYKPSSEAGSKINIYESYTGGDNNIGSCIYANGNVMEGNATITKYNRSGVKAHNDLGDYIYIEDISDGITDNSVFKPNDQYIYDYPVLTDTAEEAYRKVIDQAGASLKRDKTDTRIVNNLYGNDRFR